MVTVVSSFVPRRWMTCAAMLALLLSSIASARAGVAVQTDWSGGAGVSGPVLDLENRFAAASDISWRTVSGQLVLSSQALAIGEEYLINNTYQLPFSTYPADMDQDGDIDIVMGAELTGVVTIWLNQGGAPVTWGQQVVGSLDSAAGLWVADLDTDGDPDIVATANGNRNRIVWWRNDGGSPIVWTRFVVATDWTNSYEVCATDIDGDQHPDVLSTSWYSGQVVWWRNDGNDPITWTMQVVDAAFLGAHSARGADLDGDGDTDIVGTAGEVDQVAWWRNDGGNPIVWTKFVIRENFDGGRSVCAADFDDDGDLDIAATTWTQEVTWWRNQGGDPLVWEEQVIDPAFSGGHSIWTDDIDGDGRLDILAAAFLDGRIIWYGNHGGDPITWSRHVVTSTYPGAANVRSADLNGDGASDVIGTSYNANRISWWKATEFLAEGELTSSILDMQEQAGEAAINWSSTVPAGASLRFQARSENDPADLGSWSADITAPGDLAPPLGRYVQFRALMATSDPRVSPILTDVELSWSPAAAIPEGAGAEGPHLWLRSPASGSADVQFIMPSPGDVELTVLDMQGRRLQRITMDDCAAGVNEARLSRLGPGVYLCRLQSAAWQETGKLVVVGR
jgi:hypothetical protein